MGNQDLHKVLKTAGDKFPKKHGEWYRLHVYDNHYLVLDTWNAQIYHYPNGADPNDTDNMYQCVYVFYDKAGSVNNYKRVKEYMNEFWYGHVYHKTGIKSVNV